jgi:glycosyltransferase involved in cell wall biosynthesis
MRVCHVCSGHSADDGRVFHRGCVSLAAAGYEVHLLATGERTGTYQDRGVTIHPLPETRSRRERLARRTQVARMAAELQPDLFHVHEPELLGSVIACARSRPVIYDVHESYLDVLSERDWVPWWLRPMMRFAWDRWERTLVRRCAGVVVVTERIAQRYRKLHENVEVVANYPDLTEIEALSTVPRDGKTCVFSGGLRPDRGLSQVLAALAILKADDLAVPLALAGAAESSDYLDSLWAEAESLGVRDLVSYQGVLSKTDSIRFQQKASIGLVPYLPVRNSMAGMPNKLLECMALGLPVVFSDFPSYEEVAGESHAGIAVTPTAPEQIADAIERLVSDPDLAWRMGEAGKRAVRERFNWSIERGKLIDLYESILGP